MKLLDIYTVSIEELDKQAFELADLIISKGFKPTTVLYIDRAGKYIGYKLSEYFGCKLLGISASREGGGIKKILTPVLSRMPLWLAHILRRVEHKSGIHSVKKERSVDFIGTAPQLDDNIVLVDDAVDTGYTALAVVEFLEDLGFQREKLLVSVITLTDKTAVFLPDVHLVEYPITFPWSPGSRYHKKYQLIMKSLDSQWVK